MKYLILSILTLITVTVFAQTEIKIEDVKNHIGDSVKLMAKIYGGKYLESAQGTPTFLNVGDRYPDAPLTLVIWGDTRKKFTTTPETIYTGKNVTITGKLILYKNRPEIIITDPNQIQ
jgi:hypothetical protein